MRNNDCSCLMLIVILVVLFCCCGVQPQRGDAQHSCTCC